MTPYNLVSGYRSVRETQDVLPSVGDFAASCILLCSSSDVYVINAPPTIRICGTYRTLQADKTLFTDDSREVIPLMWPGGGGGRSSLRDRKYIDFCYQNVVA
jgi:hypothetical protein